MKETTKTQYLAHVSQDSKGDWQEHSLEDHLRDVAGLAKGFAYTFDGALWAALAGLWHDLGKYRAAFQHYIKSASGYDPEAHLEDQKSSDHSHSTAGAMHAIAELGMEGRILAYLIAGHHAGLPDWYTSETAGKALSKRLQQTHLLTETLNQPIPPDILHQNKPSLTIPGGREGFALWLRMLFSCLTDADFLDTERFMDESKADKRGGLPRLCDLRALFDQHMVEKSGSVLPTMVNRVRAEVLDQCRAKASDNPGLFSLTVPTGGGKTLSSMAFALDHAIKHNKRRIIYVIPYTSIIEQTAKIFRDIFGIAVIEHHSNLDPDKETVQSRLAAENWDAPIVVTTNVQFFESLFAARTSRCRKLHNIVDSVVVLDEAQLLPPEFLQPVLNVINLLTNYGVTFLLSTATQPALNSRKGFGWHFKGLERVREIMCDPEGLYRDLERVTVRLPTDFHQANTWEDIACELSQHESVLCIVNSRTDCRNLHRLMPKGTVHLSALMCGAHRSEVIAEIKRKLKDGESVQVISTQLVEAGVDIDFPVVYRAMTGLDSIHQAAGRCNREGGPERGIVRVFVAPKPSPEGLLLKAEQAAISTLFGYEGNPLARALLQPYFEKLYSQIDLDEQGICDLLKSGDAFEVQFRTAAAKFKLVDESGYQPIFVPYNEESIGLLRQLEKEGPKRWMMRKLQRFVVTLPPYQFKKMLNRHDVRELWPGMFVLSNALYHAELGILVNDENPEPASFVCS